MAVQVKIKFKSSWGLSHYFEGCEWKICCLEWPYAFVLGNKSPLRGVRAGPLPILLRFNYPACLPQGNEVGVAAGVKRQPVTAASPLGLSFPWWWSGSRGRESGTDRWTGICTYGLQTPLAFLAWTTSYLPYVFIRVTKTKWGGMAGITFERLVNKVGIDSILCVIRFAVWHKSSNKRESCRTV